MNKNILIVEDQEQNVQLLFRILSKEYIIHTAYDGKSAISAIENEKIDLVLLDLVLPDIHGLEVLKQIRKKHRFLPVITITGTERDDTLESCYENLTDDYLNKPVQEKELSYKIRRLLEKSANDSFLENNFQDNSHKASLLKYFDYDSKNSEIKSLPKEEYLGFIRFSKVEKNFERYVKMLREILVMSGGITLTNNIERSILLIHKNANDLVSYIIELSRSKLLDQGTLLLVKKGEFRVEVNYSDKSFPIVELKGGVIEDIKDVYSEAVLNNINNRILIHENTLISLKGVKVSNCKNIEALSNFKEILLLN